MLVGNEGEDLFLGGCMPFFFFNKKKLRAEGAIYSDDGKGEYRQEGKGKGKKGNGVFGKEE